MADKRQVAVPQEIAVEVVECTVDTLRVDDEVTPNLNERA